MTNITYLHLIGLTKKIQAYFQYIVIKKTLESISFEYRRDDDLANHEEAQEEAIITRDCVITGGKVFQEALYENLQEINPINHLLSVCIVKI